MSITNQALRVYATLESLKTNSEQDVIDALVPFTLPVLSIMHEKQFEPHNLAVGLSKLYGWNISTDVATEFGNRLEKAGYIKRPSMKSGNVNIRIVDCPKSENSGTLQISDDIKNVTKAFRAFITELGDLLHVNKSDDELLEILVNFLTLLDIRYDNGEYKSEVSEADYFKKLPDEAQNLTPEDRYICARFVAQISKDKKDIFEKLGRIAAVGMLTEVVQDFRQPLAAVATSQTVFVLDAPLALAALGVSGNQARDDIKLTLNAIRQLGCRVQVFETSCEELVRILQATLSADRTNRYGPTHMAMVRGEVEETFVSSVMKNPEKALAAIDIPVRNYDLASVPAQHKFFPEEVFEDFLAQIKWKANFPDARQHDAICMALISRLREGKKAADIFENSYVFITNNVPFARLGRKYAIERQAIGERHVAPVVLQSSLSTSAWLRTGSEGPKKYPSFTCWLTVSGF